MAAEVTAGPTGASHKNHPAIHDSDMRATRGKSTAWLSIVAYFRISSLRRS